MKALLFRLDAPVTHPSLGLFLGVTRDPGPSTLSCGPGPEGSPATAPGRAVAAPAAVFSRVSTPEALRQPSRIRENAPRLVSGPLTRGQKKGNVPELKHPPRAANGTCVMPNPPAAVAGAPLRLTATGATCEAFGEMRKGKEWLGFGETEKWGSCELKA